MLIESQPTIFSTYRRVNCDRLQRFHIYHYLRTTILGILSENNKCKNFPSPCIYEYQGIVGWGSGGLTILYVKSAKYVSVLRNIAGRFEYQPEQ